MLEAQRVGHDFAARSRTLDETYLVAQAGKEYDDVGILHGVDNNQRETGRIRARFCQHDFGLDIESLCDLGDFGAQCRVEKRPGAVLAHQQQFLAGSRPRALVQQVARAVFEVRCHG